jgi:hypothetical protein
MTHIPLIILIILMAVITLTMVGPKIIRVICRATVRVIELLGYWSYWIIGVIGLLGLFGIRVIMVRVIWVIRAIYNYKGY